jgi:hypothetical protein
VREGLLAFRAIRRQRDLEQFRQERLEYLMQAPHLGKDSRLEPPRPPSWMRPPVWTPD